MSLYPERTPPQLEALAQAIRQSNAEVQASIAHALKSYSLTVGAMALAGTCRNIEAMSREGTVDNGVIDESAQQYSAAGKFL